MDFYINEQENKLVNLCTASTTISDIIGGVTSYMSRYFINKFPENFFKKLYISDSINSKNLYRELFPIQYKPYIYIQPQFELGNLILGTLPVWSTISFITFKDRSKSYKKIFVDSEKGIYIYYIPNRIRVNYTVGIKLQTQMQAWNMLSYIDQRFESTGYHFINKVNLQAEIPKSFIINICKLNNLNYNDDGDRIKLKDYLNEHSLGGIEEIINLSTGNPSFVFNYRPNILVNYPDLPSHEKNMKNLIINHSQVNYAFGSEFWFPASFILEIGQYDPTIENMVTDYNEEIRDLNKFKYNIVIDKEYLPSKIDDKELIKKKKFITDVNVNVDKLDLKYVFENRLLYMIKLLIEKNFDIRKLFHIDIYIDNIKLNNNEYLIDYKENLIKMKKPLSNQTYNLILYANLSLLNKLNKLIDEGKENLIENNYI